MAQDNTTAQTAPLSAWERTKAGVTGFFKAVAGYLPKGMLLSVISWGAVALLGMATGFAPLVALAEPSMFISRVAISIVIGALFAGGVGVVEGIDAADKASQVKTPQNVPCVCPPDAGSQPQVSFGVAPSRLPPNEKIAKANTR